MVEKRMYERRMKILIRGDSDRGNILPHIWEVNMISYLRARIINKNSLARERANLEREME